MDPENMSFLLHFSTSHCHMGRMNRVRNLPAADRDYRPALSIPLAMLFVALATPVSAQTTNVPLAQVPGGLVPAQSVRSSDAIAGPIAQWASLKDNANLPFASYANFLIVHPGWPGESVMRKNAERAIRPEMESPSLLISYFRRFPPQTPAAQLRFAEALIAIGQGDEAKVTARTAWSAGPLTTDDESRLLIRFTSALTPSDQDVRMERLLWSRAVANAVRQLPATGAAKRTLFDARLAMLSRAPDAASKAALVEGAGRTDPGFIADRAWWLRNTGQTGTARSLLAGPRTLSTIPLDPETWYATLYANAKDAASDGDWKTAYDIARQVDDAYPAGTIVRDRPFVERDVYTNLTWLAATAALNKLGRPADAIGLFERYANAAKSGQTQSKGLYWAGRAAQAAGKPVDANGFYTRAARFYDQFHGQLAAERLGQPVTPPTISIPLEISASQREAFFQREIVRAAIVLGQQGDWTDQTLFLRAIAASSKTDVEHMLAVELAQRINRPDLGVLVGRNAYINGLAEFVRSGFPQIRVPDEHLDSWTMIHAITRQESNFDRQATSRVGARGLMQLMPGTARETAPRAGLVYSPASLTDPTYNISLGSTYFGQLMTLYNGSYVLSVAAYNAGPGNVNKWLRNNGDPRYGTDVIGWIEAIPLTETRGYVQHVLENAVVYDLLNPARASVKSRTPLSTYLGKSQPG
jgi:soluble lytic murein transglycosylase